MEGRTTFLVTHRDSTLTHVDRIVTVDSGRVSVEEAARTVTA
jgi:ABC-type bacteriocin/lantibiotic exporter with double-glycine peptidase domain